MPKITSSVRQPHARCGPNPRLGWRPSETCSAMPWINEQQRILQQSKLRCC